MSAEIDFSGLTPGEHRMPCPACDRGPKDTALSVKVDVDGGYVAFCHRCHYTETTRGWRAGLPPAARPKPTPAGATNWMRELWARCLPIDGVAADYLHTRHCVIPPADGDLRYIGALRHRSGYVGPALVGLVTDARTCKPLGLHRTWITATGKADVQPNKMMVGRVGGGVIRLWPDDAVTYGLGVAEGIETALSLAYAFQPVWSCMDAGNLAKFPPLPGIESLTIATDNDANGIGQCAAEACRDTWLVAGAYEVFITAQAENDLNDVAQEGLA